MTVHYENTKATGVTIAPDGTKRFLFCLVRPDGRVQAVVDAKDVMGALRIATGLDDDGIAERQGNGWRIYPCSVVWREG